MKRLLLIPLLFLITPYAKADMDYICQPNPPYIPSVISEYITKNCQRNNILSLRYVQESFVRDGIARWCRHDREINYTLLPPAENGRKSYALSCVLYDNKPRELIPIN
mgnify:CR=1 FL=1